MSSTAGLEVGYYMKIALDINKKVGGTRAYCKYFIRKKQKQLLVIVFS